MEIKISRKPPYSKRDSSLNFYNKESERNECKLPFSPTLDEKWIERKIKKTLDREWWKLVDRIPKRQSKFSREFKKYSSAKEIFLEKLPELLTKYAGKYIAIIDEDRFEIGDDKLELYAQIIKKYGYISIYLSKITDKPRTFKIRQ